MVKKPGWNPAVRIAARAAVQPDGQPAPGIHGAMLKAVEVQRPLVLANLRRLRRRHPHLTPAELADRLERDYLTAVTAGGAAVGATAIVPGLGTVASLGLSAVATVGFLEATALYAQSIAELHGIHTDDPERSRTMVMAIMLGEEGRSLMQSFTGKGRGPSAAWGTALGTSMPKGALGVVAKQVQKRFVRKFIAQQGAGMLGRAVPFGIGAVFGGAGNHILGRRVVTAAKLAFGPLPVVLPRLTEEEVREGEDGQPGQ